MSTHAAMQVTLTVSGRRSPGRSGMLSTRPWMEPPPHGSATSSDSRKPRASVGGGMPRPPNSSGTPARTVIATQVEAVEVVDGRVVRPLAGAPRTAIRLCHAVDEQADDRGARSGGDLI